MAQTVLLGQLLLVTLFAYVHPWVLTTTHTNVIPKLTKGVTLRCFDNNLDTAVQRVDRIRIQKLQAGDNSWHTFAIVTHGSGPSSTSIHLVAGKVGKPQESFLSVSWPLARHETVGQYRCEVLEFNNEDNVILTHSEKNVNITADTASIDDLLDIILTMRESSQKTQQALANVEGELQLTESNQDILKKRQSVLKNDVSTLSQNYESENSTFTQKLSKLQETFTEDLREEVQKKIEDSYYESRNWPKGPAAVPLPHSGCPQDSLETWTAGYISINQNNQYPMNPQVSVGNHLLEPLSTGKSSLKIAFLRSCKITSTTGIEWPKGSYCVYSATSSCPTSFTSAYVQIKTALTAYVMSVAMSDNFYYTKANNALNLYFCCRSDGNPNKPIVLPTAKPFYLFRYKGRCQTVANTRVTGEWINVATSSNFKHGNIVSVLPDRTPTGVGLQLCYYQGQN